MLVLFGIFAPISMFWLQHRDRKVAPSIVSASFLALPYAHYALSRADALHVSHGVLPGLMVLLVAVSKLRQIRSWYTWVLVIGVSAIICLPQHPFWMCRHHDECERVQVGAGEVEVPLRTKEHINLIRSLANRYAPNGESFIAAPYWPGAYSLLERKAPVWEIYAFAPRTPEFETNEIERIKQSKPEFAIICDLALDDKQELRFQSTHPVTFQFIRDHMTSGQPLDDPSLHLFVRKAKVTWNP